MRYTPQYAQVQHELSEIHYGFVIGILAFLTYQYAFRYQDLRDLMQITPAAASLIGWVMAYFGSIFTTAGLILMAPRNREGTHYSWYVSATIVLFVAALAVYAFAR